MEWQIVTTIITLVSFGAAIISPMLKLNSSIVKLTDAVEELKINGSDIKTLVKENEDKLNEIFDTDKGSRYVGEFSFGLNPKIMNPIGDILYDEKIAGSIHFTPGSAYKECYNGNDSNIHWDMVLIQRSDYGGGEIYFDNKLIRKDGKFVLDELKNLNY